MRESWNRRNVLGSGAALVALGAAMPARGQDVLRSLLGDKLPEPLKALLPRDAQDAAKIVGELLSLEDEAKTLRLPDSALTLKDGAIPTDPDRLYQAAMPRLVALIDRAERVSPAFADKAGALLAQLHQTQHDVPDAWFGGAGLRKITLPGVSRPLRIASPLAPDEAETPDLSLPGIDIPAAGLPEIAPEPAPESEPAAKPLPPLSRSLKYADLAGEYAAWFDAAAVRGEYQTSAEWHLTLMRQSRSRYQTVGRRLGVPWYFIAAIHGLEASFNFRAHYHNGDFPLSRRTRQVPANRPPVWLPPSDWESSAADALKLMGFAGASDWSLPRTLYRLEAYNGFGYRRAGRVTPYLWSFSSLYSRGKFVADGRFDPKARSQQCGAAVMLKLLEGVGELG
jgi:lysozyme family protein